MAPPLERSLVPVAAPAARPGTGKNARPESNASTKIDAQNCCFSGGGAVISTILPMSPAVAVEAKMDDKYQVL